MARQGASKFLHKAKKSKSDEFYTQYIDIQKEVEAYLEYNADTFKGKVVYCNCDDPFESNFFRYFILNFDRIGLKRLITTSYKPSPVANTQLGLFGDNDTVKQKKGRPKVTANKFIINSVGDIDGDGEFSLKDVALLENPKKQTLLFRTSLTPRISARKSRSVGNWFSKLWGQFGPEKRGLFGRNFHHVGPFDQEPSKFRHW